MFAQVVSKRTITQLQWLAKITVNMNEVSQFIESALLNRTLSRRDLRGLQLRTLISGLLSEDSPIPLKCRAYLLESLSAILARATSLLLQDILEFQTETFYFQKKGKENQGAGTKGHYRRKKKKSQFVGTVAERALATIQKDVNMLIENEISSEKHMAEKMDITLPKQGAFQADFTLKPQDDSEFKRFDNFREILDNTLLKNLPPLPQQSFSDFVQPRELSGEKQITFIDQLKKNLQPEVSKLATTYKELLDTGHERPKGMTSIRRTRRKTAGKINKVFDQRVNIATLIEDLDVETDRKETKKKMENQDEQKMDVDPTILLAEELQNLDITFRESKFQQNKGKLIELQRNVLLNESLSNTFFGHLEVQMPRFQSQRDFAEYLSVEKSISSRSDIKSSNPSAHENHFNLMDDHPPMIQDLTTIVETTDAYASITPIKKGEKMTDMQKKVTTLITSNMQGGEANLNKVMAAQKMPKRYKAMLFYEVLGLNFKLRQESPSQFSDIMVAYQ